jgi:hypothetical protein
VILVEGPFGVDTDAIARALRSRTGGVVQPGAQPPTLTPDGSRPGLPARAAELNARMRAARTQADAGTTIILIHGVLALAVDHAAGTRRGRRPSLADTLRRLRADAPVPDVTIHLDIAAHRLRECPATVDDPTLTAHPEAADRIVRAHRLWRARDAQAVAVLSLHDATDVVVDHLIDDLLNEHDLAVPSCAGPAPR